jgi:hypothetical protein
MANPAEGLAKLLAVLDRMEIHYSVGGSVAGSEHGIPRTTFDADLVTDLRLEQVEEFATLLAPDFYADAGMMRRAFEITGAFNVIHYASAFKFDLFPLGDDEYSRTEFDRRSWIELHALGSEPIECAVASPEDTMLRILEWYRAGGETRHARRAQGQRRSSGSRLDAPVGAGLERGRSSRMPACGVNVRNPPATISPLR